MSDHYLDRTGDDPEAGAAIRVAARGREARLELGTTTRVGALSVDAWAALSPDEAEDLASDLLSAARKARENRGKVDV